MTFSQATGTVFTFVLCAQPASRNAPAQAATHIPLAVHS
jgi:hypothetical protein